MKRVVLIAILGILAVVLTAVAAGMLFQGPSPKQPDVLVSATPSPAISETKETYTDALTKAKDWQSNATLSRVYHEFTGKLDADKVPLVFSFSSLADPKNIYEVSYAGDDVSTKQAAKKPFELTLVPIDVSQWNIDPDQALKAAEDDGGKAFRDAHLAGYSLLQQLSQVGSHPLQWYFRYDTGDGSKLRYEVWINATTGQIDTKKETTR